MALFDTIRLGSSGTGETYEIQNSLRHNSGAYLNSSFSGNNQPFTVSMWIKRGQLDSDMHLMSAAGSNHPGGADIHQFGIDSSNRLFAFAFINSNSQRYNVKCNAKLEDCSNWYHLTYNYDSTQSTSSNRIRLYINGVLQTDLANSDYPSSNEGNYINGGKPWIIGHESRRFRYPFQGYFANIYFIDGQYLEPTAFGETVNGVFIPKEHTGSYSGTSFFLEFQDASDFGKDTSGESNGWAQNNYSNSNGINGDQFTDVPTNNFCTRQNHFRSDGDNLSLENGLVRRTGGADKCLGTFLLKNNKYYFEYQAEDNNGNQIPGVTQADTDVRCRDNTEAEFYASNGEFKIESGRQQSGFSTYGSGDIIGVAIDTTLSTPKVWFAKNNSWQGASGNSGTFNASGGYSLTAGKEYVFNADHGSGSSTTTGTGFFGAHQGGFNYTPPTGFVAASAANLPNPSIKDGRKHFHTLFYTGNGSNSHAITGLDFSPDWVMIKARNATGSWAIFDTVRGATKRLGNSGAGVGATSESTVSASLKSFDSNGFTFGNENGNNNGENYVAWCWNAGNSTITNTDGSISAQVRANATCGFSIVSYTGDGASSATLGHGLGVTPKAFVVKSRSQNRGWNNFHHIMGNGKYIQWNQNHQAVTNSDFWNNTSPTSSVFTVGTDNDVNDSAQNYIAYVFAEVDGFSKFGEYVGNGNSNGTYVITGFRPSYVFVKTYNDASEHWNIPIDVDFNNPIDNYVSFNLNNAERGNDDGAPAMDFYSNGFKIRTSYNNLSHNSADFIYWAFARNPFKHSNAR